MPIAYAASTDCCTFLLDEDGVCRRVLLKSQRPGDHTLGGRTRAEAARRCIGAQYVATIDVRARGALVPMPLSGAPMLFAYAGEDGRLAVVRTGPLVRFETMAQGEAPGRTQAGPDDTTEDDDCMTVPLHQSGERASAPTLKRTEPPPGRGMLPRRANRG